MQPSKMPASKVQALIAFSALLAVIAALGFWQRPARADWHTLTGLLPEHVDSVNFVISPDSQSVIFVADVDTDNVDELYAVSISGTVPVSGTGPLKLNPPLVAGGEVLGSHAAFTPDGQSVIYLADQEVDNRVEMFRVPVGGGMAVKLNSPLVAGGNVARFTIDAKNARIVYLADQETNEVQELWSIPLEGGMPVKLNGPFGAGGNTGIFRLDPLSNRVVYSADQDTNGKFELYSVPVMGGMPLKLNPPIVLQGGGDSGIFSEFDVNPIAPVVVFVAREAAAPRGRLYMIPTAGGTLTQLSFEMLTTQRILSFRISPGGDRVVFSVAVSVPGTFSTKGNLYSALIGGGGAANVTETADPLFGVDTYQITPNGSHVIYSFQKDAGTPRRLESATMLGVRVPLYAPSSLDDPLGSFAISPDSQWVRFDTLNNGFTYRLYTIPPTGGNATNFGPATFKLFTPDSARIAYTKVVSEENRSELFSAQTFSGDERNLSGMDGTGYILDTKISADGKWIVFATQVNERLELRVSDGAAAQPTATPTLTPSVTPTPSQTPSPTFTATPTLPGTTPDATPGTPIATATGVANSTPASFHARLPSISP